MDQTQFNNIVAHANLCDDYYMDTKALYLQTYRRMPSVSTIYRIDHRKAFEQLKAAWKDRIEEIFTYRDYNNTAKQYEYDRMIVILKDVSVMIEFDGNYAEILHSEQDMEIVDQLTALLAPLIFPRYLTGRLKKRILFLSPTVAQELTGPVFIELLMSYPESILVIEDAESILMDRSISENSSVSNLLNLSDGLLADCLNVQVICTFNSALSAIDSALLRKGRLIAQYEFRPLSVSRAQLLSRHLGFDTGINRPMTIAEIANQHEQTYETKKVQIGFRAALQA